MWLRPGFPVEIQGYPLPLLSVHIPIEHPSEPVFVNFEGAQESIPSLAGRYYNLVCRTGAPGFIGWRSQFLGIDSWAPLTFTNTGSVISLRPNVTEVNIKSRVLIWSLSYTLIYCNSLICSSHVHIVMRGSKDCYYYYFYCYYYNYYYYYCYCCYYY